MHSITLYKCISEPTTTIWMKIDSYYHRLHHRRSHGAHRTWGRRQSGMLSCIDVYPASNKDERWGMHQSDLLLPQWDALWPPEMVQLTTVYLVWHSPTLCLRPSDDLLRKAPCTGIWGTPALSVHNDTAAFIANNVLILNTSSRLLSAATTTMTIMITRTLLFVAAIINNTGWILKPNTHRRRDATVKLSRVGGVNTNRN